MADLTVSAGTYRDAPRLRVAFAEQVDALLRTAALALPAGAPRLPADEWSAAHVLAHVGEFPRFFAADLRRWVTDRRAVLGRTLAHEVRLAAVSDAKVGARDRAELIAGARDALATLAGALDLLTDADLEAPTQNVRYGEEPLRAFLDRYVVGHLAGHVDQLKRCLGEADR